MFNERNPIWIEIYRVFTIGLFFICVLAGIITGFIFGEYAFLEGFLCFIGGIAAAFIQLVFNMMIIQFLNNIQIIRRIMEKNEKEKAKQALTK